MEPVVTVSIPPGLFQVDITDSSEVNNSKPDFSTILTYDFPAQKCLDGYVTMAL